MRDRFESRSSRMPWSKPYFLRRNSASSWKRWALSNPPLCPSQTWPTKSHAPFTPTCSFRPMTTPFLRTTHPSLHMDPTILQQRTQWNSRTTRLLWKRKRNGWRHSCRMPFENGKRRHDEPKLYKPFWTNLTYPKRNPSCWTIIPLRTFSQALLEQNNKLCHSWMPWSEFAPFVPNFPKHLVPTLLVSHHHLHILWRAHCRMISNHRTTPPTPFPCDLHIVDWELHQLFV
mmetsp:Transcript_16038/g.29176  ORF Transcript_16038/g.29176 Transcript_16038/m.29176 type:complete len:230 (-) Transcript_16038:1722-2411(-)